MKESSKIFFKELARITEELYGDFSPRIPEETSDENFGEIAQANIKRIFENKCRKVWCIFNKNLTRNF